VQERARTLGEVYAMTDFLYLPDIVVDLAEWERGVRRHPAFAAVLKAASERYAALDEWTATDIHDATVAAGEESGVTQIRKAQEPIRLAITGRSVGPPLWESLEALGRDRTLARLAEALRRVTSSPQDR
jgi:glutamyl-tRNA synthetase